MLLLDAAFLADDRIGVEEDLYVGVGENFGPDVAAFHDHSAGGAQFALARHHPLADFGMHRDPRRRLRYVGLADATGDVAAIEEYAVSAHGGFNLDARFFGELGESVLVIERHVPLNGLQRQRAVHGAAFEIHIAQFAGQARGDGALSGARGAVDGDD